MLSAVLLKMISAAGLINPALYRCSSGELARLPNQMTYHSVIVFRNVHDRDVAKMSRVVGLPAAGRVERGAIQHDRFAAVRGFHVDYSCVELQKRGVTEI